MPKGYWVSAYRTISDPEKLPAHNKLAGPAVAAHESAACQEALVALSDGVECDLRIVEGID
ncbi:hypothetical protein [Streptomyces sp. NPDC096324]|uniref:hypothetical protein n=1 Tax=Streptomyces sp. NPDC096324 TaxID=3366085 RepID=UPI00380C28A0